MVNGITGIGEVNTGGLCITIAGLTICITAHDTGLDLLVPPSYQSFLQSEYSSNTHIFRNLGENNSDLNSRLVLEAKTDPIIFNDAERKLLYRSENWELWSSQNECQYTFIAPRLIPPRQIITDTSFKFGEVSGNFSDIPESLLFPLEGLDIRLFSNWLANFGDVILHAAGVCVDGRGYCFPAPSGYGKSTLLKQLVKHDNILALGEDQVILRLKNDQFWIYGTPWHENPDLCSPLGVPLKGFFFLERNGTQNIKPMATIDSLASLIQNAFIPFYRRETLTNILENLSVAVKNVPSWRLDYKLGTNVWELIQTAQ